MEKSIPIPIPTSNPPPTRGLKGIISRVSSIRVAYPNSVSIYRDLNTTYQSCYEIAVNVSEQYNSYRRAGQRISGIRTLLADCDAILKKVHGFLQRYSSLRSQRPTSKEKFAFVSEDIEFQRRRVGICRGKLGEVQRLLQGADYSSQQNVTADEPGGLGENGDIPVGDTGQVPPVEEVEPSTVNIENTPTNPLDQKPPHRSRSQKRNTRLATAASVYRWEEVRSLVERGADVNTSDSRGLRPLVYALNGRYRSKYRDEAREASDIVRLLLSKGAKFGKTELDELPRAGTYGEREYRKWVTKENLECEVEDLRFEGFRDSGIRV